MNYEPCRPSGQMLGWCTDAQYHPVPRHENQAKRQRFWFYQRNLCKIQDRQVVPLHQDVEQHRYTDTKRTCKAIGAAYQKRMVETIVTAPDLRRCCIFSFINFRDNPRKIRMVCTEALRRVRYRRLDFRLKCRRFVTPNGDFL